jgi:putative glutamine amidotransferase
MIGVCLASLVAFRLWIYAIVPTDAPRIAFSLDESMLNKLGITTSTYRQLIARAGGRLVPMTPDVLGEPPYHPKDIRELLESLRIDGILLTGGGDVFPGFYGAAPDSAKWVNKRRDDFEIALIKGGQKARLPIFGICRGAQILNVAFGSGVRNLRVNEDLKNTHFSIQGHAVDLLPGSIVAEAVGVTRLDKVHSFHGQAVVKPGSGLRATAWADDGVIEAIEGDTNDPDTWIVGVQWHPEMALTDPLQMKLVRAFVEQARRARDRRLTDAAESDSLRQEAP